MAEVDRYIGWLKSCISNETIYHNHKENMAWLATAFYIPIVVSLGYKIGIDDLYCTIRFIMTFVIIFALMVFLRCFICVQFKERWRSAERGFILKNILVDIIIDESKLKQEFQQMSVVDGAGWHKFLEEEIDKQFKHRYCKFDTRWKTEVATYVMIIGATIVSIFLIWAINPIC